jgi:hypothetical protein
MAGPGGVDRTGAAAGTGGSSSRRNEARRGACAVVWCDGRVAGAPRLAVAEDVGEPYLHLPRSASANCVRSFKANHFNFPPAIAWIIIVQNLPSCEHDASLPVRSLPRHNWKIQQTIFLGAAPMMKGVTLHVAHDSFATDLLERGTAKDEAKSTKSSRRR